MIDNLLKIIANAITPEQIFIILGLREITPTDLKMIKAFEEHKKLQSIQKNASV